MIKIGAIGCGGRGNMVKLAHKPDQGSMLAGVCDLDLQSLQAYQSEFGEDLLVTDDYRKLISDGNLDAIFIGSPDFLHEEHAVAALEAGLAVYLEKPMGITIAQCDHIMQTAAEHGNRLFVGHNMRFFPVMLKMKELIDQGEIGQVQSIWCRHFIAYGGDAYFKNWNAQRKYSTGMLLQKGAHDIDVIHWLAGAYTQRTTAMGKLSVYNQVQSRRKPEEKVDKTWKIDHWPPLEQEKLSPVIDIEDHSMVLMQLSNGVQASYSQSHYTPDSHRNYTIIGTQGRIENMGDHSCDEHWAKVQLWNQRSGYLEAGTQSFAVPPIQGTHGGADPMIINDFLQFVQTGKYNGATPLDARMSVATGCCATESLRNNSMPVDVPEAPVSAPTGV